ncbi:MAG: DUF3750 domain-containing protein [Deltaproteobacteria bacterium]|jgi:hypothetical protein|nr:DUF3750 domain-containing protein [Deltaproteobacteria bacterium]MBT4526254.1 DUF3750 domain-containing protein [Deltaproteobacteria bacterium]
MLNHPEAIPDKNQVWLYCSPLPLPLSYLALHCWFVLADQENTISRWEIWQRPQRCKNSWGHLHQNLFPMQQGINRIPGCSFWKWPSKLLFYFDHPVASTLTKIIGSSPEIYPYHHQYRAYPGPNSNTYIQWVLDHLSAPKIELPTSAIGKNWIASKKKC